MVSSYIMLRLAARCRWSGAAVRCSPKPTITILLGVAAFLLAVLTSPVRAESGPLAVDFFLHLADGPLTGLEPGAVDGAAVADDMLFGAIPLRVIGEEEGGSGWRMVAGATGRYTVPLTHRLTMIARAGLTTTDFIDRNTPDRAVTTGATEFRYTRAGWTVGLQPGLEIVQRRASITQRDSSIEARLAKTFGDGISIATSGQYRWRELADSAAPDREIAVARLGLAYRKPQWPHVDTAYMVRREVAQTDLPGAQAHGALSMGPSVNIALPLGEAVDLVGSYDFTRTVHHVGDGPSRHLLDLGLSWSLQDIAPDMRLSATYRCEVIQGTGDQDPRHAGTVNFAFNF